MILFYFLIAYALGSLPFGVWICRLVKGEDPRDHGSQSTGATNVARVAGLPWGILVFLLDVGKGYLAVQIPVWISPGISYSILIGLGAIAIVAHSFSVWLSFKGGKGVATALGAFFAITFVPTALAFGVWTLMFLMTRTVSTASIIACGTFPILVAILNRESPGFGLLLAISSSLTLFIFYTHRENIRRILKGKEKKNF